MLTLRKNMMSNTCSQLHMCNMYNTLMKYAHTQEKKNHAKMYYNSTFIIPASSWRFLFIVFIALAIKTKFPEIPAVEVGKKLPFQVSLCYLGNIYNTLISMLPLKKNMSNTWLQLYVQLGITRSYLEELQCL
jgi:hypothetical protein